MKMKLSHFNYHLPEEFIVKRPAICRDESRLLVFHRNSGKIEHKIFHEIIDYFDKEDVMVLNNTKVFHARIYGNKEKTGAKIEVFLLRELDAESRLWDVLVDPARKIRIGNRLYFSEDKSLMAEIIDNTTSRGRTLRFLYDGSYQEFCNKLEELGQTPLPKYIQREPDRDDDERYQSIFAKHKGAIAAPAASLHFSKQLVKRLEIKGINFAELTLHIGLGTFRPLEVEDLSKHKIDNEEFWIYDKTTQKVNRAIDNKKRICAIGTTVMRAMESSVSTDGHLKPYKGWTNKFIFPPYNFNVANCMITNFHQPQSISMIMTAAFAGYRETMKLYKEAIKERYRFLSYGDAMLIL